MNSLKLLVVWAVLLGAATFGTAQNLLVNGNFDAGNVGFSSTYVFSPGNIGPPKTYDVVANPQLSNPFGASFVDHTSGSGLMLAANGSTNANDVVWSQTVAVNSNCIYIFSGWGASWSGGGPAVLKLVINDSQVGPDITLPNTTGQWKSFTIPWDSQSSTQAVIQIFDKATAEIGNDLALDDLVFAQFLQTVQIHKAVEISWPSVSNQSYQVQWLSTLSGNSWSNLGPPVLATGTNTSVFDRIGDWDSRFYRIEQP